MDSDDLSERPKGIRFAAQNHRRHEVSALGVNSKTISRILRTKTD